MYQTIVIYFLLVFYTNIIPIDIPSYLQLLFRQLPTTSRKSWNIANAPSRSTQVSPTLTRILTCLVTWLANRETTLPRIETNRSYGNLCACIPRLVITLKLHGAYDKWNIAANKTLETYRVKYLIISLKRRDRTR